MMEGCQVLGDDLLFSSKTNKLIEGFYKHTMNKHYKNKFINSGGIGIFLDLNEIRWYEDVIFKQEIIILTEDIQYQLLTNYLNP